MSTRLNLESLASVDGKSDDLRKEAGREPVGVLPPAVDLLGRPGEVVWSLEASIEEVAALSWYGEPVLVVDPDAGETSIKGFGCKESEVLNRSVGLHDGFEVLSSAIGIDPCV